MPYTSSMLQSLPQFSLFRHVSRVVNCVLHSRLRHTPQLIGHLFCFFASFFNIGVWPFEVECQVEILLVFAL